MRPSRRHRPRAARVATRIRQGIRGNRTNHLTPSLVIPAQAGIQGTRTVACPGPRFRGGDSRVGRTAERQTRVHPIALASDSITIDNISYLYDK